MPKIYKQTHRFLHAFCVKPSLRFETQSKNEEVILLLRAHPITQLPWIITAIIILLLPLFFNIFIVDYLSTPQLIFINLFWYSFLFAYIFLNLLNWLFNVGLITNQRIVDVDFHAILHKEVTESLIPKIEDVTVKSSGFLASFFNYGNLFIQTAGTEANIEFIDIPNPAEASSIINDLMKNYGN